MKKIYQKMGQAESKQKLEQITQSLTRIRKDVRTGKITANDIERVQGILQRFATEIDVNLSKKVRASDVYTAEQLIEITGKELDALKQEVNLDLASVSTNSFSRGSSKKSSKDKNESVKGIKEVVEEIRKQIRTGKLTDEECNRLQGSLAHYSQRLSYIAKKNNKQVVDAAQKLVSSVTAELITKQQGSRNSTLVRRSVASPPPKTDTPSIKPETPKLMTQNSKESYAGTLDDIEKKLNALKSDIKVAESNKDKNRLHFLAKSIQTLMANLQMVNVKNQILDEERKALLESNLVRYHQQIDKIKRRITEESDLKYLTELHKKEKKEKSLQDLDDIQKTFMAISANLNHQNYDSEKETFNLYKTKLNSIEEGDQEVSLKRAEVSDVMLNVENAFTRLEMEERLNQAEWKHCQYKIDLGQFADTPDSSGYQKHRQYLIQLRGYVSKILEISNKIDEKKKYVLYNIDNNIIALDHKAKENQDKLKGKSADEVVLRRSTAVKSNRQLAENLAATCRKSTNLEELKKILPVLDETKSTIEEKLGQKVQKDESEPQLVRVKATSSEPVINSVLPVRSQMEKIQKEVEALQAHVESSYYGKESQLYKDIKNQLGSYKAQITNLSRQSEDGGKFGENLLKYVDNVLLLLDSNMSSRKSTTEDVLIDIMSVSTRVNDLGSKIQGFNHTVKDCESIKSSLLEHQHYLRNLQISSSRSNLYKSRDDILRQIERYLTTLDNLKKNENDSSASEEEKRFNQNLRKLKEKVSRYSGTYKNVLYKSIENDLNKSLDKVDHVYKDTNIALKVKRDIENSKMILEQKSTKDQNYNSVKHDVRNPSGKELTEIRDNVESVKRELSQIRALSKEELDKLDARLTLSILALDNIKDDHSNKDRDKLYKDIHFYFAKIQELMSVSKPHSILLEDLKKEQLQQQQQAAETIATVESELEEVKPQILTFVGTETSQMFFRLDEVLVRGTLKLDELNLEQTSELYHLKVKLMREIHKYSDILDERIDQTEEMEKLEKEVKVMLMKIDSFNGYFGDPEYAYLDEQIISLKVSLGKLHVNQELVARREACIKEVDGCMKKLNDAAKTKSDGFAGTLV
ncbi:uncharacterized protein [Tenebrio molitor]|uniref:uncharacterized protein n=1 Tax=Tenebrio molitor TaxID=7067 RepID=UPI00362492EB